MAARSWDDPTTSWDAPLPYDGDPPTTGGTVLSTWNQFAQPDTHGPTAVAILSPTASDPPLSGTVTITVTAHDDRDEWVESVYVYFDGVFIGQCVPSTTADQYVLLFDTTQPFVLDGPHVLSCVAIDNANNLTVGPTPVAIVVSNAGAPPAPYPFTTTELLDIAPGVGVVQSTVDWEVWIGGLQPAGFVHPRQDSAPTIEFQTSRPTMRQAMNVMFVASDLAGIDQFRDEIQAWYRLPNGARLPLGRFCFADFTDAPHTSWTDHALNLLDRGWILDQPVERTIVLTPGKLVLDLFVSLCAEVGITDITVICSGADATVGAPLGWPAGTSRLVILTKLAALLGCYAPHFTGLGTLLLKEVPDLVSAPFDHVYNAGGLMVEGSLSVTDSTYKAPNRYIVTGGSADTPVVGYFDVPSDAPHSIARRGYVVAESIQLQVASSVAAQGAAIAAYAQDVRSFRTTTFNSTPNPRHDAFDVLQVVGAPNLETGWSLDTRPGGLMQHTASEIWTGASAVG